MVSDMSVPTLDELHRPVLEISNETGRRLTRKDFVEQLRVRLSLTEADMHEMLPSGSQTRMENRTNWAITDLKLAGLMNNPLRNQWEITVSGRNFLMQHSGIIRLAVLEALGPEEFRRKDITPSHVSDSNEITPDEMMARGFLQQQSQLAEEVLNSVKAVSPESFERLCNRLLSRMVYGEIDRETGHSGDQGFDGILNQDRLGLEKVYVQAKRYDTTQVGEPEIRTFSGSLDRPGALKGVFVTTSTFLTAARQAAVEISRGNKTIRLIDGQELAQLMIQHGVGVVTEITYEVKKLDANYFEEV